MGGLRYEVWTLPWSASFARVIADLPVAKGKGSGTIRFNEFASGQAGVPADYSRLGEVIGTDVGSLIRVYDGTTIVHEWVAERVAYQIDSESGAVAVLSGPDLASAAFDAAIVYPFDYPLSPSIQPDHIWGGTDSLANSDFEENNNRPTIFELYNDGAGADTFTATDGVDTTSAIDWDASASTVETRFETDITAYDDVLVTGEGTVAEPWIIEYVTPTTFTDINLSIADTGMTSTLTVAQYGAVEPSGWTKSQSVSHGVTQVFGDYDSFVVSTAQAQAGTSSLFIDPGTIGRRYAGAQQVINVTPGATYQASVWVRPTSGATLFRFVIRGVDGDFIASDTGGLGGTAYTANVWSEITIADVVIPASTTQIIFRIANVDVSGDPAEFYVDSASFSIGAAIATGGTVIQSLLDDAAVDHAADARGAILDWIDYSGFDGTNDSSTTAWGASDSITIPRGMSYGQVLDKLRGLGYEFSLTPKATVAPPLTHDFNFYDTDNMGTDYTAAATPSVRTGQGTHGGTIIQHIPRFTALLTEGAGGVYLEATNATPLTDFGRLESYHGDVDLTSTVSITSASTYRLAAEEGVQTTAQLQVVRDDVWPVPLVHYTVADLLKADFPPVVGKNDGRVLVVSYRNTEPVTYQVQIVIPAGGGAEI